MLNLHFKFDLLFKTILQDAMYCFLQSNPLHGYCTTAKLVLQDLCELYSQGFKNERMLWGN